VSAQSPNLRRRIAMLAIHAAGMLATATLLHNAMLALAASLLEWGSAQLSLAASVVHTTHAPSSIVNIPLLALDAGSLSPGLHTPLLHAALMAGVLSFGLWQRKRQAALAACLIAIGGVHGAASLWAWLAPLQFPRSLLDHTEALTGMFVLCLYLLPLALQAGFASLGLRAAQAWRCYGGIVAALLLVLPLQMLVHTVVAQHFSHLMLPLLLACAAVINAMLVLVILGMELGHTPRQASDD
jgi:hypothetical protein